MLTKQSFGNLFGSPHNLHTGKEYTDLPTQAFWPVNNCISHCKLMNWHPKVELGCQYIYGGQADIDINTNV